MQAGRDPDCLEHLTAWKRTAVSDRSTAEPSAPHLFRAPPVSHNTITGRIRNRPAPDGRITPGFNTGHVQDPHHLYARIGKAGGAKFWFHGLRNSFITIAERELMLPPSLTKRLVNHARPNDVTQGYAADWTIAQLREPAQKIADRIEALMTPTVSAPAPSG